MKELWLEITSIALFLMLLESNEIFAQTKSGHLVFGIKSYEVLDSTNVPKGSEHDIIHLFVGFDSLEIYYNRKKVFFIEKSEDKIDKHIYDRSSKINTKHFLRRDLHSI